MAAILDFVNFHRFKELEKNTISFFSHHYYVPNRNKQKNTFNEHFARKYIRAYTNSTFNVSWLFFKVINLNLFHYLSIYCYEFIFY